jgi:hypothetical protein
MASISDWQALEVRRLYVEEKLSGKLIGAKLGISPSLVSTILLGTNWSHLGPPLRPGGFNGSLNGAAKLNEEKVKEIRERDKRGEDSHALAREFNVTHKTIRGIVLRHRWKHVS